MHQRTLLGVIVSLICCAACVKAQQDPAADAQAGLLKGQIRLHDPAGIVEVDGYLMTFATGRRIRMRYMAPGTDEWVSGDSPFGRDNKPAWIAETIPGDKGYWAPHAAFPA